MAPKNQRFCIFRVILSVQLLSCAFSAQYNWDYKTVADCLTGETASTHEYYDISQLACLPCSQDATYQTVTSDGLTCLCQPGFRIAEDFGGANIRCEPCPNGMVTSSNGWQCVECENGIDPVLNECYKCQSSNIDGAAQSRNIAVERLLNGTWSSPVPTRTCETCELRTGPDEDGNQCVRCNQILSVLPGQIDCVCPAENQAGGLCFQDPTDIIEVNQQLFKVKFGSLEFESAYFAANIQAAAGMCQPPYSNITACQVLGNLCALLLYTKQYVGVTGSEDACALYIAQGNEIDWPENMPWLYYLEDSANEVLQDDGLTTKFTFPSSTLDFRAAQYTLDGEFQGYKDANNGLLQLCGGSENELNAAFKFGTFYEQACKFSVSRLWDEEDYPLYFYDLYIEYEEDAEKRLYAVPIQVTNYQDESGNLVNEPEDDIAGWQLVRRLFLVDNISGKRYTTEIDPENPDAIVPVEDQPVRYAKDITIHIELQSGSEGLIYPPYLEVTYAVATAADKQEDAEAEISFKVNYRMSQADRNDKVNIAIGVLAALAAIYSAIQTWGWSRRSGRLGIDFVVIVKFLVYAMGNLANVFFVVMLGYALWWVIFYKRQNTVTAILPNRDQEGQFVTFIACAFALKFFQLLHLIICQVTVDIFFIDWERPRGKVMSSNDAQQKGKEAPVSIWRTYFAANEWNEIQTTRKISHMFQIFAAIFFLEVIGFGNLATKDPYSNFGRDNDFYYSPDSRIFRFGIMGLTYLIIAVLQWIFYTFIYERFVEHKIRQYVDLCSMSNISVFILETGQFGYYIHGRSVHGRADTGMREMAENLKREEENLCGQRGLLPNTEKQTFQISVQAELRHQYDRVVGPIYTEQGAAGGARATAGQGAMGATVDPHTDKCLQAYSVLNRFLQAFIDHSVRDIDYIIKDKTFMENLLSMEFIDPLSQSFFYNDSGTSFASLLFYGHENTLIIFEILIFAVVDLAAQNYILAAVVTFLFMELLGAIRDAIGRSNLAKKTLVDKRFLI